MPVENNRPVKKGDVLFRIDPTPYTSRVDSLEAKLVSGRSEESGPIASDSMKYRRDWRTH